VSPSLLVNIINSNYKGMYKVILQVHSEMYIKIQLTTYAHIVFYFATIFNRECILQIKKNEVYSNDGDTCQASYISYVNSPNYKQ
jgi:hypothetical protein